MFRMEVIMDIASCQPIGYEILYRGNIPNDVLFKKENAELDIYLLNKACKLFNLNTNRKEFFTINIGTEAFIEIQDLFCKQPYCNCYFEMVEYGLNKSNYFSILEKHSSKIIVDDFGVGNANFDLVFRIKPYGIKLDRVFLQCSDNFLKYLLKELQANTQVVIFEKIETIAELRRIEQIGFRYAQGYVFNTAELNNLFVSTKYHNIDFSKSL